jgi:hypothetical protein
MEEDMITTVNVVHIVLNDMNDPDSEAGRYIAREMSKGILQSDIVKKAWIDRFKPVPARAAASAEPTLFKATDIYYDPAVALDGSEQEVIDVIVDASKR